MVEFKVVPHAVRPHQDVVEVWIDGQFMATITPPDEGESGIRVISKHTLCPRTVVKGMMAAIEIGIRPR